MSSIQPSASANERNPGQEAPDYPALTLSVADFLPRRLPSGLEDLFGHLQLPQGKLGELNTVISTLDTANWDTTWFVINLVKSNPHLGSVVIDSVRELQNCREKSELLGAIGVKDDLTGLISFLNEGSVSDLFSTSNAISEVLLREGNPEKEVQQFGDALVRKIGKTADYQDAHAILEEISRVRSANIPLNLSVELDIAKNPDTLLSVRTRAVEQIALSLEQRSLTEVLELSAYILKNLPKSPRDLANYQTLPKAEQRLMMKDLRDFRNSLGSLLTCVLSSDDPAKPLSADHKSADHKLEALRLFGRYREQFSRQARRQHDVTCGEQGFFPRNRRPNGLLNVF